jgi:hypothetical protein
MTRLRDTLVDLAVVVVVVVFGAAFFVARRDHTRYDGNAKAIATWARDQGVSRVAWPQDLRTSVPVLLHNKVVVVLVDERRLAPQQLAVNHTPVVVTRGEPPLNVTTRGRYTSGPFVVRLIDLGEAAKVPLEPGQQVGEEISRPYRYAPLRDSRFIAFGKPLTVSLRLSAGRYVFTSEAFDPKLRASVRLVATQATHVLAEMTRKASRIVQTPYELAFSLSGRQPVDVVLRTEAFGAADVSLRVHAWRLTREVERR